RGLRCTSSALGVQSKCSVCQGQWGRAGTSRSLSNASGTRHRTYAASSAGDRWSMSTFQIWNVGGSLSVSSSATVIIRLPSRENAAQPSVLKKLYDASCDPVFAFQNRTVSSLLVVTTSSPSGWNATEFTLAV